MLSYDNALFRVHLTPQLVTDIATTAMAIGRLDVLVAASQNASSWLLRSAWAGYTRALQLQGVEIDEIDTYSWGCGLSVSGRPVRATTINEFEAFSPWWQNLQAPPPRGARGHRPYPHAGTEIDRSWPGLLRAIEFMRQYTRHDGTVAAWLSLPSLLREIGCCQSALPCLVSGAKAFRFRATPTDEEWRTVIRGLGKAAENGESQLLAIESHRRRSASAIVRERRPGSLPRLFALCEVKPLLSPQMVARDLGLSLPGAGKLLARAAEIGMVTEITGRMAWRRYLVPDLAIAFGFVKAPRGRPKALQAEEPLDRDLAATFASFDEEMRLLDIKLARLGQTNSD